MRIRFAFAALLFLACDPPTEDDLAAERRADDDAGLLEDGAVPERVQGSDAGSEASPPNVMAIQHDAGAPVVPVIPVNSAGTGLTTSDAAVRDAGSVPPDSGLPLQDAGTSLQGTVVWSNRTVTTTNLGAIGTQPYHRARLQFSLPNCSVTVDSPFYPSGWSGSSSLPLSTEQRACLRDAYDCATKVTVYWSSCSMPSCSTFAPGAAWTTTRPACSSTLPLGAFSLRLTVARLASNGLDETWEIVAP